MKKLLIAAAALSGFLASGGAVLAADPGVLMDTDNDWSGFYAGVHGGYGWADTGGVFDSGGNPGPIDLDDFDSEGEVFGVLAGYNHQFDSFVLGVEADISESNIDDDDTFAISGFASEADFEVSTEMLASIRARAGVALGDILIFGTVGIGYVESEFSTSQTPKIDSGPNGSISNEDWGLVYGGGIEYSFGALGIRAEYMHYDTSDSHTFDDEELVDANDGDEVEWNGVDVVRGAIILRFNAL